MIDDIDTKIKIIEFQKLHGNCFGNHRKIAVHHYNTDEITLEKFNILKQSSNGFFNYDVEYTFFYDISRIVETSNFADLFDKWKRLNKCSVIYTRLFPYLQHENTKIKIHDFAFPNWKLYNFEGTK